MVNWTDIWTGLRSLRPEWQLLLLLILFIWLLRLGDALLFRDRLKKEYSLQPRTHFRLGALLFSPFIHANRFHLLGNTFPLLIYGSLVALYGLRVFLIVSAITLVTEGLGTWLLGKPGNHLGISGLIFGYFGFTLVNGLFAQDGAAMLLGVLTGFLGRNGFAVLFRRGRGISASGHWFGFTAGIFSSWLINFM